jgi:phosphoribosylglycinamide formyltransferase 1
MEILKFPIIFPIFYFDFLSLHPFYLFNLFMKKLAIFASGSGTNAENIINYFKKSPDIKVDLVLTNRSDAFVIERAKKFLIDYEVFNRTDFYESDKVLDVLDKRGIDFIILAGFLWLIPVHLIKKYPGKIINIHPALLPKYGGKGMYGMKVHEAVINNHETRSGISIHLVNENYDEGEIIFQAKCNIESNETPDSLANKVHQLEYEHFPKIIEKVVLGL